jgi:hypothetical protein
MTLSPNIYHRNSSRYNTNATATAPLGRYTEHDLAIYPSKGELNEKKLPRKLREGWK